MAAGKGIGEPWQMNARWADILILDRDGVLWRWRPSDAKGRCTLAKLRLGGETRSATTSAIRRRTHGTRSPACTSTT
jgi:hypothetical protein